MRTWRDRVARGPADEGASAVEFALVVIPLVLLVFGIIGFGILLAQQLGVSNAARQGARSGAVQYSGATSSAVQTSCSTIVGQVQDAAKGTIKTNQANVFVQIWKRPAGTSGGSDTQVCAKTKDRTANSTVYPCSAGTGTDPGDSLVVEATYTAGLVVPLFVADPNFTLHSKGVFECEYH
jgi:Flp pilus assembly protein TadG